MCPPILQGVPQLALCLSEESDHTMKAATVWSIGQIGHHTPEHAKAVATANLLPKLLELYMDASSSEDLQAKVRALKIMFAHSLKKTERLLISRLHFWLIITICSSI